MEKIKEYLSLEFLLEVFTRFLFLVVIILLFNFIKKKSDDLVRKTFSKLPIDKAISTFFFSIYSISYYFLYFFIFINIFDIKLKPFITILSASSIIAGFAFKETLSNLCSGIILLTFKPFKIGHQIEIKNYVGEVKSIELFYTKIKNFQNEIVVLPNSLVTLNELRNITKEKIRRLDLYINVSYDSDIDQVKDILNKIVERNLYFKKNKELKEYEKNYILPSPKPVIGLNELGANSMVFILFAYVKSENLFSLKLKLNEEIKKEFDKQNIKIPYEKFYVELKKK